MIELLPWIATRLVLSCRCSVEEHSYNFLMPALTNLLKKQAEQNPTASYFNVDIIKYQVECLLI